MYGLVLVDILPQLHLHPGNDDQALYIINLAFKHFHHKEPQIGGPNETNGHDVVDLYAEVLGIVSQSRFALVRRKFTAELNAFRHEKETSQVNAFMIVNVLMGMRFLRIKVSSVL